MVTQIGKTKLAFEVSKHIWNKLTIDNLIDDSNISMNNVVFVIASSANHFNESMDAIVSPQKYMYGRKIIYYDIEIPEMTEVYVAKVYNKVI